MDIHRCRFVPYNPHAINALAFSHPPSADTPGRGVPTLRLAIGRANGDIEIWNPLRGSWLQETVIRGGRDRSIEGLAWTIDPVEELYDGTKVPGKIRLFSIGASSVVTEWDLVTGKPARHSAGNFGEIWSLAAQPAWKPHRKDKETGKYLGPADGEITSQHLAVGCADGSIVLLSTADGDLKYVRTMRPSVKKARVLSIAFQNRQTIVAGYADSTLRVFDIRNSKLIRTVSLGRAEGRRELLVWSVKCLPDGGIVTGDSSGEVRFWDGRNYSLIQRLQAHQADVLDIAISADGQTVLSGGADQRTTLFKLKGNKGDRVRRWQEVMHRRYHTHDVKAFAVYETKDISIVVSGGLDTVPVVVPLREYGVEHHRKLSSLPQTPQIASAPSSRVVMGWWDREVNLYRIAKRNEDTPVHKLVGKVLLQGEDNLSAAALSTDGRLLAAATLTETKIFTVRKRKSTSEEDSHILKVRKVELPQTIARDGARTIAISPDNKWLVVIRPDSQIYVACITIEEKGDGDDFKVTLSSTMGKLNRVARHERHAKETHGTHGSYDRTIKTLAFSSDSRIMACGDLAGCIDTWILRDVSAEDKTKQQKKSSADSDDESDSEDEEENAVLEGQQWIQTPAESPLPRNPTSVLLLTFRPQASSKSPVDKLIAVNADHAILEFDVLQGKLSDWSRRNPKSYLPADFTAVKDRAMGAFWDVSQERERLWLYGPSWIWMFDLAQDLQSPEEAAASSKAVALKSTQKRKREEDHKPGVNTGAGDRMPLAESYVGVAKKMRRVDGPDAVDGEAGKWVQLQDEPQVEGEDENETSLGLAKLRRQGEVEDTDEEEEGEKKTAVAKAGASNVTSREVQLQQPSRKCWHTYKYREMLGILPLSRDTTEDEESEIEVDTEVSDYETVSRGKPSLEVAVIERPMWDVDLPGRYLRDYE